MSRPSLLVYVSSDAPDPDPLEELRAVGAPFRSRLPTVIRNALKGQLTEQSPGGVRKAVPHLGRGGGCIWTPARVKRTPGSLRWSSDRTRPPSPRSCSRGRHDDALGVDELWTRSPQRSSSRCWEYAFPEDDPEAFRSAVVSPSGARRASMAPQDSSPTSSNRLDLAPSAAQRKVAMPSRLAALQSDVGSVDEVVDLAEARRPDAAYRRRPAWHQALSDVDPSAAIELVAWAEAQRLLDRRCMEPGEGTRRCAPADQLVGTAEPAGAQRLLPPMASRRGADRAQHGARGVAHRRWNRRCRCSTGTRRRAGRSTPRTGAANCSASPLAITSTSSTNSLSPVAGATRMARRGTPRCCRCARRRCARVGRPPPATRPPPGW